ncbi:GMC family oxidoreductase N-terminal domain-containing protein [Rhodococcus sp. HM1]|uniref:GMC family oxidoreductase N-terminal domain-containing protein n=1 Tax=unclassified Rhodococcus (in: high G+C Gram-positive bacteria) TaxID=192944 RepID=UPI0018CF6C61|nr:MULTISPECIES: GMC family oxidoreductase N-terminal domain-containing protein [unclassified Rhodococcus (in: high G+C Gram-positive bacteria)]MBH0118045.1 GMC family oxidoreductase [Rhodococcus sp. CX]MCK8674921.1 GMC family oxidoreductase N-terminal domain-containing protein [Rhodococcus sp. HM1]
MRDVIVIGSGGGGPVVAKELAARGLDVLVVEAGPRFADPESEWTHFEDDANNPLTGFFRQGPGDRSRTPWLRDLPQNSYVWQVAGVGGTTLHYFGNSPRAVPGVFVGYDGADRNMYDTDHLFPFGYDELRRYYEWVEATLPVQTAPMGTKERIFLRGAAALGLPHQTTHDTSVASHRAQQNAILQPGGTAGRTRDPQRLRHPEARGCTMCGHCYQGCYLPAGAPRNLKAKRSTDNSYVPMMLTAEAWAPHGRAATLVTDATVTQVLTEDVHGETTARGVRFRTLDGEEYEEHAQVVVLAAGAIESPRLWLASDLPNPNDWVGRGLTDHHMDAVFGVFDEDTGQTRGAGSNARVDLPGYGGIEQVGMPPALQAYSLAFSDSGIHGYGRAGGVVDDAGADTLGRLVGRDLLATLDDANRTLAALVITDDDVEPGNRVTRSTMLLPDEGGLAPKVTMRHRRRSERTRRNREYCTRKAVELMRAAGARSVHRCDWPPLILHAQSSMRMGTSGNDSVLDATGEARWVKRLFVADNSALANSLGGPNPTLTTQALATRTSEAIFRTYFGGDAWVGREDPVSSVDDRVTAAVIAQGL